MTMRDCKEARTLEITALHSRICAMISIARFPLLLIWMMFSQCQQTDANVSTVDEVIVMEQNTDCSTTIVQEPSRLEFVKEMISRYKNDPRGPYLDIRWFCRDGTTRPARDPCPDRPGNQRARYREEVNALASTEHIFLGQILATTPYADFWDAGKAQSRLKQYQLELYLRNIDNGWINRRAQYYRGAVQTEDENNWGIKFYQWLLEDTERVRAQYFLIRQSAKDIPHTGDNNNMQLVRSLSKEISDHFPAFLDLRVKIHGLPDEGDLGSVRDFQQEHKEKIRATLIPKFDQLIRELEIMYRPFLVSDFDRYRTQLPGESEAAGIMTMFMEQYPALSFPPERCRLISHTALQLRRQMALPMKSNARLALIDISINLERLLHREASQWQAESLKDLLSQVYCLSEAAAAFGFLEMWEWEQLNEKLTVPANDMITLQQLSDFNDQSRRVAEWGTGMVRAHYMPVINLYQNFEPLVSGFFDDRVRSSVLLHLGNAVSRLGDAFSHEAGFSNDVLGIRDQSSIHGLNPGYTVGELVVISESPENVSLCQHKIYVFHQAPENLTPVAGIVTVTEGNLVSHVQLLARNLGIPNAVISEQNMHDLKAFNGTNVFYAVSNKGTVIMKPASTMDHWEQTLFAQKKRSEEKISVPVGHIVLDNPHVLNLRDVDASQSGKIYGPKAANLGQLKRMFPENVVEGLVLPFAVFRQHMDQTIPGYQTTYWAMLHEIFDTGKRMKSLGEPEPDIEASLLHGLDSLRGLIRRMPLIPAFRVELAQQFLAVFGKPMGQVPVFVRSDTNMEDLKDFTGAGLNLTVFNVLDPEKILQGIRDVWASAYTERSYTWRQRFLSNPENVFPSILIIPSVDADYSGVLITKGVTTGRAEDITVAFNRGVGGAVEGQAAESWLLGADGTDYLITPARESSYLSIPATGGSVRMQTTFEQRILHPANLASLRELVRQVLLELPGAPGINTTGPFDIELGFKDHKMWLFQVRPFVENKQAVASEYLQRITPVFDGNRFVSLDLKL